MTEARMEGRRKNELMEGRSRLQNERDLGELGVCGKAGRRGGDRNRAACLEGRSQSAGRVGVLLSEGHVA